MKTKFFLMLAIIFALIVASESEGLCQFQYAHIYITNLANNRVTKNKGTFFSVSVRGQTVGTINGVTKITAKNSDLNIDGNVYEFSLTPMTRNLICEWVSIRKTFKGQHGAYEVTVEGDGWQQILETTPLPEFLSPLPIPSNLTVSFEYGPTNPTLSLDPVYGVDFDIYDIRIFDKNHSRRIYRTEIPWWESPIVTFPDERIWNQTAEDLVPGETYIFRADIWKALEGTEQGNLLIGRNYMFFKVPKKWK